LEKNAQYYDVVITDMELLDGYFDDVKQGIDILELCENEYPFIVTRVVTSLPKNALKRLIQKGIEDIIFKNGTGDTVIPPFENLVEFVKKIDNDVQKRRLLRSMPGPEISWWGKYLTKQLHITKIKKPDEYNVIWNNAINLANRFIKGELDNLNEVDKISIEFKQVSEVANKPASGWEIIERLLTHRLIALWFSSVHSWDEFYYSGDGVDVYANLNGFKHGLADKTFKSYFNTFLGLSVESTSYNNRYKILPKKLFPEEYEWLSKTKSDNLDHFLLREINDVFQGIMIYFMKEYNGIQLSDDVTFAEAMNRLDEFVLKYPGEKKENSKHESLKNIFTRDLDEYYETLPSEAKNRIDKIKAEIFPI